MNEIFKDVEFVKDFCKGRGLQFVDLITQCRVRAGSELLFGWDKSGTGDLYIPMDVSEHALAVLKDLKQAWNDRKFVIRFDGQITNGGRPVPSAGLGMEDGKITIGMTNMIDQDKSLRNLHAVLSKQLGL